jgi:hypothetical protein
MRLMESRKEAGCAGYLLVRRMIVQDFGHDKT